LIFPLSALAQFSPSARFALAASLTLSPVFFSGLIFAESFKGVSRADQCLAANLLGSLVGGFSEYSAMLIGYRWLVAVAIGYYIASWVTRRSGAGRDETARRTHAEGSKIFHNPG
jgi:hypothetical protein